MCGRDIMARFGVWGLVLMGKFALVGVRMGLLSCGNFVRGGMGCGKIKGGMEIRMRACVSGLEMGYGACPTVFLYSRSCLLPTGHTRTEFCLGMMR